MKFLLVFLLCFFSVQTSQTASEKLYINVGKANVKKSLLALTPLQFFGSSSLSPGHRKIAQELYSTIFYDLDVSSYFKFIKRSAYLENPEKNSLKPLSADKFRGFDFENWSAINTEFLIKAGFNLDRGEIEMASYVYHVPTRKLIFAKRYRNKRQFLRKIAHRFSNDVLEKLTGRRGMFESRIVVSSDRAGGRHKEIFIMDWDGKNPRQITRDKSIAISPAWSNDNKKIAFTSFAYNAKRKTRNADLFLYDLRTGRKRAISTVKGINSGAAFIPGSNDIMLTISKAGVPNLYRISQAGRILEQLTFGPGRSMNVEPALSWDGQRIAFSSDRSGRPMIFTMNMKKSYSKKYKKNIRRANRIVYAGWYNASPSWSPDGQRIVFAGMDKYVKGAERFDIFSMRHDGHDLIRLTTSKKFKNGKFSNNEDPVYSPDGRHVMFISDRTGNKQIYIVNADGTNERRITFDKFNYYKPKWSTNID